MKNKRTIILLMLFVSIMSCDYEPTKYYYVEKWNGIVYSYFDAEKAIEAAINFGSDALPIQYIEAHKELVGLGLSGIRVNIYELYDLHESLKLEFNIVASEYKKIDLKDREEVKESIKKIKQACDKHKEKLKAYVSQVKLDYVIAN